MNLPYILAGPIVRRVEPRQVSVWVALSEAADVELSVWEGSKDHGANPNDRKLQGEASTLRVGDKLHVALVTARVGAGPIPPMKAGKLYSYDLRFKSGGTQRDLSGEGLLSGSDSRPLGYHSNRLPAFVLPPADVDDLKVVHASCRKMHGMGEDALPWVDGLISNNLDAPLDRPHQLFLTGDQIYADDVPIAILGGGSGLTAMGRVIIGADERVNLDLDSGPKEFGVTQANFPAGRRQWLMRKHAEFSSNEADSHLVSLGEYCAMYLLAWNEKVWPQSVATDQEIFRLNPTAENMDKGELPGWENWTDPIPVELHNEVTQWMDITASDEGLGQIQSIRHKIAEARIQRDRLQAYKDNVWKVRRALANVPTYMIFDDHEVTDDWYVTRQWKDRVLGGPKGGLGPTVLRNGMLSYALFQGWGNAPDAFEGTVPSGGDKPGRQLLDRIADLFPANATPHSHSTTTDAIDELLGLTGQDPKVEWHYRVPGPKHEVLVLDTRTTRSFSAQSRITPPRLVSALALERQVPKGPLPSGKDVLLVVSPVPVLGVPAIDELFQPLADRLLDAVHMVETPYTGTAEKPGVAGREFIDVEAWAATPEGLEALLERLAPYRRVVLLSGDVHYAFSAEMSYWRGGETARFAQFTSSPSKNNWPAAVGLVLKSLAPSQRVFRVFDPVQMIGWEAATPETVTVPDGADVPPTLRARLRRDPVRVPAGVWPTGTSTARPPDWAWQIRLVSDTRPDAERPTPVQMPDFGADLGSTPSLEEYKRVAARHLQALARARHGRDLVFDRNVGRVTFERDADGDLVAVHDLLSRHPNAAHLGPKAYAVHRVNLAEVPSLQPTL